MRRTFLRRVAIFPFSCILLMPMSKADEGQQRGEIRTDTKGNRLATISSRVRDSMMQELPDIGQFQKEKSDRFLVDLNVIQSGHPYKGKNAQRPHTGGHIYFKVPEKPLSATQVERFPAIYAASDGIITRVDYSFRLRKIRTSATRPAVSNTRYGIGLMFARSGDHAVELHYSIEPFVDPGDELFYDRFIFVRAGQQVKKGDVIARMYIPNDQDAAPNTHIHFNLIESATHSFQSPSIFNDAIVQRFHALWGDRRGTDNGTPIPACMGYRLAPEENPFAHAAIDAL